MTNLISYTMLKLCLLRRLYACSWRPPNSDRALSLALMTWRIASILGWLGLAMRWQIQARGYQILLGHDRREILLCLRMIILWLMTLMSLVFFAFDQIVLIHEFFDYHLHAMLTYINWAPPWKPFLEQAGMQWKKQTHHKDSPVNPRVPGLIKPLEAVQTVGG